MCCTHQGHPRDDAGERDGADRQAGSATPAASRRRTTSASAATSASWANGQAQYWAPDLAGACDTLLDYYERSYVAPGERFAAPGCATPWSRHPRVTALGPDSDLETVGAIFSEDTNPGRKPFDVRSVMRAVADADHEPLELGRAAREGENAVAWDAHLGGWPVSMLGIESRLLPRFRSVPADGPESWSAGTLFPQSSRRIARAIQHRVGPAPARGARQLAGFDGSPRSMRRLQLGTARRSGARWSTSTGRSCSA